MWTFGDFNVLSHALLNLDLPIANIDRMADPTQWRNNRLMAHMKQKSVLCQQANFTNLSLEAQLCRTYSVNHHCELKLD